RRPMGQGHAARAPCARRRGGGAPPAKPGTEIGKEDETMSATVAQPNGRPGQLAPEGSLVNVPRLLTAYYSRIPDARQPAQRVAFGTSGHRGCAFETNFN